MLGTNVGTTLIVQVLSFNIAAVAPVLFIVGLVAFRGGARTRIKDLGRVAIGLGLMLLALHILLDTLAPAEEAPGVRVLLNAMTGDPVLCIVAAAALTWAAHSSVAIVLLVMSLAFSHFVTPAAALALVLGANLGSAINPIFEGAHGDNPATYRLPVGNLLNRIVGVVLVTRRKLQFSTEGAAELTAFHKRVLESLKIAFGVFMSGDVNEARKLIAEKSRLRNAELVAAERHLERLRKGQPETLETTSLHLDVLRDLKRIHSHICSVVYPVLDAAGAMPAADVAESDPITLAVRPKPAAE
jgi:phosphate:Na+ symporter